MKTTLIISDPLFHRLKSEAARQKKTMSELVESGLRTIFKSNSSKNLPPLPVFDLGEARVDISNRDALYDLMEQE